MKSLWMITMVASAMLLLVVVVRNGMSFRWLRRFALHLVAAALVLYLLNYSGVVTGFEVPLNPATIGTVVLLGLPGIALVLGLQMTLF
ncbi:pro-sigmaK processing inhibitor BofA family protein [Paenibacillus sp. MWE-103]|uniref:Pro-sigmaK processing inhibitor BofA family protein n=1 Tax=Paenibacillus artemisiicola TaxID=1172618 RepID=A0ABS3WKC2_9BACL|nr:pro-sigmaK processing inhibitor BofA family protein [Paenibacillus artemisiicola]MBO7748717.1 pro-sigmaK processing inhibitor BofA family protein [Paenibacillus artemisiicola]